MKLIRASMALELVKVNLHRETLLQRRYATPLEEKKAIAAALATRPTPDLHAGIRRSARWG